MTATPAFAYEESVFAPSLTVARQTLFDQVLLHLRRQGRPSLQWIGNQKGCAYRGLSGTSCAIGCLLTDEEYDPRFESIPVTLLASTRKLPERLIHHRDLLNLLQRAHDAESMGTLDEWREEFESRMRSIAREFGLHYAEA